MLTIYMSMFLVLACIDMGVKQYIEDTFEDDEERETMIPKVVLRKVYNKGFAFNVLERNPGLIRRCSLFAAAGLLACDCWIFTRKKRTVGKLGMTLVSAGAVSNLYDRLIRRKVIDYIGIRSEKKKLSDLTANLADGYITVGAFVYGASRVMHRKKKVK